MANDGLIKLVKQDTGYNFKALASAKAVPPVKLPPTAQPVLPPSSRGQEVKKRKYLNLQDTHYSRLQDMQHKFK